MDNENPPASGPAPAPGLATARSVALSALCDRAGNVTAHLKRLLEGHHLAPADAALARELALGTLRRQGTLDAVIDAFRRRGNQKGAPHRDTSRAGTPDLPARIRAILRLGLYQVLFTQRVPAFAAVNETVNLVGRGQQHLRGFVNGLLRSVARDVGAVEVVGGTGFQPVQAAEAQVGNLCHPKPAAELIDRLGPQVLPVSPTALRRFARAVFPDPAADAEGYAASALSLPPELARRWMRRFGGLRGVLRLGLHANARPPLVLRVDLARASVPQVLESLAAADVPAVAHANGQSVVVLKSVDVARLAPFQAGLAHPQDAAATAVLAAAELLPGMAVLDLCAAPGTKTVQAAYALAGQGRIVAADVSGEKLALVEAACRRLSIGNVQTVLAEQVGSLEPGGFDLVLVDAPCSNTGVLARRGEARWRFSPSGVEAIAKDQLHLLLLGGQFVRPGGRCVYSTCSLEPEENQQVAQGFLRRCRGFELQREQLTLPAGADAPSAWTDGGYFAIFRRKA